MCVGVYICLKALQSTVKKSNKIDTPGLLYIILCGFQERM